jgi:hypothetical protein
MKKGQRVLLLAGIMILAALLAFPMRKTVFDVVVVPFAYIFWMLGLVYHAFPQFLWWVVVIVFILFWFGKSLAASAKPPGRVQLKREPPKGQVEGLAEWIQKSEKGIYNKWLVANRLGKLAYGLLSLRNEAQPRSIFAPLEGPGWVPDPESKDYLHSGLQGSFADFSHRKGPFAPPVKTPLDHDPHIVITFLESQIESNGRPPSQNATED